MSDCFFIVIVESPGFKQATAAVQEQMEQLESDPIKLKAKKAELFGK